ncbi:MAG TPA: hypothetical protein VJB96_03125 [Patescibacteria group bacterium]|nr:hypothetical protein [Patescibacteria group bacterium]
MIRNGFLAILGLFTLYAVTMTALSGIEAAVEQFRVLWYLMLPLVIGFGIQVGLYTKLKQKMAGMMTTSGTSAGVGMLACCAHHVADVLPILGLSAAATLIGQYQKPILMISLLINIIGIGIMWRKAQ